jgi:glycosyltransferase involved in cell wall biosynthesis
MKVLHIIPTYYPAHARGGPIWSVHNLNKWLIKKGVDVTVYTTDLDIPSDKLRNKKVNIDGVNVYYFSASFPKFWEYSRNLHKKLKKTAKDFDLIHITSTFLFASTLGAYYAKKNNIPYIISPRGNLMNEPMKKKGALKKIFYVGLVEERNLQNASAIHFTVKKEKEEYEELGFIYKKSILIPNGIDPENFEDAPDGHFRQKFNISDDKKIVLFLSRISWKKGLDTLLPAFRKVVDNNPNTVLVIAGGDTEGYKKRVEQWINENNLQNDVIFTGMITGKDKTGALKDSNVFVLPSYSENFGMAVVEAMNFSLPVVITENVGISNKIIENNAGLVVSKDETQVSNAILRLLNNENFAKDIGERGRSLVAKEYLMANIADEWVKNYQEIIEENY